MNIDITSYDVGIKNVKFGENVKIIKPVNLYNCEIGDNVFIGPFTEIQGGVKIGNNTRISSHTFICSGVEIGKDCFIGHGVMFTNDKFDSNTISNWKMCETKISDGVRIGSNTTILPVNIGSNVIIGGGSVVTKDVNDNKVMCGNPAKELREK